MTSAQVHLAATSKDASLLALEARCDRAQVCPLSTLSLGSKGRIVSVSGEREFRRRLLEMGFCNGAEVQVMGRAPLGDPVEFKLRGYCLCLRDEQAACILVATKEEAS
jgi:Fe2+ transport system protein FeoA